jgi:Trypsin
MIIIDRRIFHFEVEGFIESTTYLEVIPMKHSYLFILFFFTMGSTACEPELKTSWQTSPIIGGTLDTNPAHDAVAYLLNTDGYACGGTLIYPNILMTAAHCVTEDNSNTPLPPSKLETYFCRDLLNCDEDNNMYAAIEVYVHPNYDYSNYYGDFALVRLASPVSSNITPIPPLPPSLGLSSPTDDGMTLTFVGYGRTIGTDSTSATTDRMVVTNTLEGVCHDTSSCTLSLFTGRYAAPYSLYIDESYSGTCKGDSGGPGLATFNGTLYAAGITSYGYGDCAGQRIYTEVSHYTTEIQDFVDNPPIENCENGVDDDGNGFTDCFDDICKELEICEEILIESLCNDTIDNDNDGLTDCDDPDCTEDSQCNLITNETDCDDGIDNDNDGVTDCEDSDCNVDTNCNHAATTEIDCGDGTDNDNDGQIDCDDSDCQSTQLCNEDEGSGSDSGCSSSPHSQPPSNTTFILLLTILLFAALRTYRKPNKN